MSALAAFLRPALDLLAPPACPRCEAAVDRAHALCADCWRDLRFIGPWRCRSCGVPFEFDGGDAMICAGCRADPPPWDRARSAVVYDDGARPLILAFKHADRTDLAPMLVRMMATPAADLLESADCVAPVPLHWLRLATRRYNQSALLAQRVAKMADKPYRPQLLRRVKRTAALGSAGPTARRRLLQGAIKPAPGLKLAGARVLLVDDVLTTGATAGACARALKRAGASAIDVLCFARAVRS